MWNFQKNFQKKKGVMKLNEIYIAQIIAIVTVLFTIRSFFLIGKRIYSNKKFDKKFNIKTQGTRKAGTSNKYNRTESTPYTALLDLKENYHIPENFRIVDYGSGKGRSTIMLHHLYKSNVTGVEVNSETCNESIDNYKNYKKLYKNEVNTEVFFVNDVAENYKIKKDDNVFFIFNSFHFSILNGILEKIIRDSKENFKDPIVILYYPTKKFMKTMKQYNFTINKEIKTRQAVLPSEKFIIYNLNKFSQ